MLTQQWRQLLIGCLAGLLSACVSSPTAPAGIYSMAGKEYLYNLEAWQLDGRIAISAPKDSWSAHIDWQHAPNTEKLKLSGPLGQGAVAVNLAGDNVTVDRGNGRVLQSDEPERFINQQLGIEVPLRSLRYWAIGVPEPDLDFQATADGFVQSGWLVDYREMQQTNKGALPQKLSVSNKRVKLKLIIDQWILDGRASN